jgi:hypothetical protein
VVKKFGGLKMSHSFMHFKGKSGSNTKRKRKSSRKQRRLKRGTKINKYKEVE